MNECSTCRYSRPTLSDVESEGPILKCHRYPPTLLIDLEGQVLQAFPDANESCGEYQS